MSIQTHIRAPRVGQILLKQVEVLSFRVGMFTRAPEAADEDEVSLVDKSSDNRNQNVVI